jgi:ABC-type Fe3+ transport system permease subunit
MPMDRGLPRDYAVMVSLAGNHTIRNLAMIDSAQQRIDQLERDKRWWKRLAIGFMIVVALVLIGGAITSAAVGAAMSARAREAEREAMNAKERARQARQLEETANKTKR